MPYRLARVCAHRHGASRGTWACRPMGHASCCHARGAAHGAGWLVAGAPPERLPVHPLLLQRQPPHLRPPDVEPQRPGQARRLLLVGRGAQLPGEEPGVERGRVGSQQVEVAPEQRPLGGDHPGGERAGRSSAPPRPRRRSGISWPSLPSSRPEASSPFSTSCTVSTGGPSPEARVAVGRGGPDRAEAAAAPRCGPARRPTRVSAAAPSGAGVTCGISAGRSPTMAASRSLVRTRCSAGRLAPDGGLPAGGGEVDLLVEQFDHRYRAGEAGLLDLGVRVRR